MGKKKVVLAVSALTMLLTTAYAQAAEIPTKFTNKGSISNTRHNLTQAPVYGEGVINDMDGVRNNYGEVCVYCHTPHGANSAVAMPLWNRTLKQTTYTTYDQLGTTTITQTFSQPGTASLTCLSCHDGQTSIDSIVNMPGSGRYDAASLNAQNNAFLATWTNVGGKPSAHARLTMDASAINTKDSCLSCHKPGSGAPDFSVFAIGTDLRNDHPVGVTYPLAMSGPNTDWNTPTGDKNGMRYFDLNTNGKMDSVDVRLYNTAGKPQVECASCHDPHGVPSAGPGSQFNPSFLRVNNTGSKLCLTCHAK